MLHRCRQSLGERKTTSQPRKKSNDPLNHSGEINTSTAHACAGSMPTNRRASCPPTERAALRRTRQASSSVVKRRFTQMHRRDHRELRSSLLASPFPWALSKHLYFLREKQCAHHHLTKLRSEHCETLCITLLIMPSHCPHRPPSFERALEHWVQKRLACGDRGAGRSIRGVSKRTLASYPSRWLGCGLGQKTARTGSWPTLTEICQDRVLAYT